MHVCMPLSMPAGMQGREHTKISGVVLLLSSRCSLQLTLQIHALAHHSMCFKISCAGPQDSALT